ncbi:MFS transporter [Micromonospora sp. CPCC 206061]|uniref:MFS transporter n=1 Tax=Micromonospora sp. CPCC 206061 TaxID=3122410 RepID=UPI002FEFFA13
MTSASPAAVNPGHTGALFIGVRLGLLYGPAIWGASAAGVALPVLTADLAVASTAGGWVLTAHGMGLGIGTALFGRISDSWGARRTLLAGALALGAGAVLCLAAPTLPVLVMGRLLLGAGSGAMTCGALSLAVSGVIAQRAQVFAVLGTVMSVFSASATLVGGLVTAATSWRVTCALPGLSMLAVPLCLPVTASRPRAHRQVDALGAALLATAVAAVLVLIQARSLALPAPAVTVAVLLLVCATAMLARRSRRPDGFVPRRLVTNPTLRAGAAAGAGIYGGLFATMYVVPHLLAQTYGWGVEAVGAVLLPGAVVGAVVARLVGRREKSDHGLRLLAACAAACAVCLGSAAFLPAGALVLVAGAALSFAAVAAAQVALTARVSAAIAAADRGAGIGLLTMAFFVGGAIGSAAASALSSPLGPYGSLAVVAVSPLLAALIVRAMPPGPKQPSAPAAAASSTTGADTPPLSVGTWPPASTDPPPPRHRKLVALAGLVAVASAALLGLLALAALAVLGGLDV